MNKICEIIATLFYSGYSAIAPGTVGTFLSLIICLPFAFYPSLLGFTLLTFAAIIAGFVATHIFLNGKTEDLQHIVIDEMAGLYIAILLPMVAIKTFHINIQMIYIFITSFILFRIFDITKPLIIGYADKNLHGAIGIMMDDIIAGLFAGILLSIIILTYHFFQ